MNDSIKGGIAEAGALGWGGLALAAAVLDQSPALVAGCFVVALLVQFVAVGMIVPKRQTTGTHKVN